MAQRSWVVSDMANQVERPLGQVTYPPSPHLLASAQASASATKGSGRRARRHLTKEVLASRDFQAKSDPRDSSERARKG